MSHTASDLLRPYARRLLRPAPDRRPHLTLLRLEERENPTGTITGVVFQDINTNGLRDEISAVPTESGVGAYPVPPDRGIFLGVTRRMHPDVCRFISEAVYEGRLHPAPENANQRLVLSPDAEPALSLTGVRFVPVAHEDCSQKSEE